MVERQVDSTVLQTEFVVLLEAIQRKGYQWEGDYTSFLLDDPAAYSKPHLA